jgi:hypothetical protein
VAKEQGVDDRDREDEQDTDEAGEAHVGHEDPGREHGSRPRTPRAGNTGPPGSRMLDARAFPLRRKVTSVTRMLVQVAMMPKALIASGMPNVAWAVYAAKTAATSTCRGIRTSSRR